MWPFQRNRAQREVPPQFPSEIHRASHMVLLSPGSYKERFEQWASQQRDTTVEIRAEIFQEDFPLDSLPSGWDVCPYLDEQDGRILLVESGIAFAFSYGALVYVSIPKPLRQELVASLRSHLGMALAARVTAERFAIQVQTGAKPTVLHNAVVVGELTPSRLVTMAVTIAQSVAMEYYEHVALQARGETLKLLMEQRKRGKVSISNKRLARQMATASLMQAEVVGVLHLLDKPESIWDDPEMDAIYEDLRASFDLAERFKSIEYKLEIVRDTMRILSDAKHGQMALRLEAAVTLFVFIEVVLSLGTHFGFLTPRM